MVTKTEHGLARSTWIAIVVVTALLAATAWWCVDSQSRTALEKATVQLNWFPGGEHSYLYLGKAEGVFADAGFDLHISGGKGSELAANLLASGRVDFALMSPEAFVATRADGGLIRSIGAIYDGTPVCIYSLHDKNITKLEDLQGKTLGVLFGSNTFIQYKAIAKRLNLDRDAINEVTVPGNTAPGLLLAGKLDALMYYTHHAPLRAVHDGYRINEIMFRDLGIDMYGMLLVARDDTPAEVVERFVGAIEESIRRANSAQGEAIKALLAATRGAKEETSYEEQKLRKVVQMREQANQTNGSVRQTRARWVSTLSTIESVLGLKVPEEDLGTFVDFEANK